MPLSYRGISMDIVHARQIAREAVFSEDRTTYLYTRWAFDVDCVWNPGDVAWVAGGPAAGTSPTITDAAVRHLLMQPRGELIFTVGTGGAAETLLRCPAPPATIDLENGPRVEACTVQAIHGSKTFAISLRITCAINECPSQGETVVLLSHRWRRYASIDQDYYTTITTEGEAVFRADELVRLGRFPAEYRADLLHNVPTNFKRQTQDVMPSEDGTRLRYRTVDRELPYSLGSTSPATRVEAYVTIGHGAPSMISALLDEALDAPTTLASVFSTELFTLAPTMARRAAALIRRTTPKYNQHILIRLWGDKQSSRLRLTALGLAIMLNHVAPGGMMLSYDIAITHDIAGRFVEVTHNRHSGMEAALATAPVVAGAANFHDHASATLPFGIGLGGIARNSGTAIAASWFRNFGDPNFVVADTAGATDPRLGWATNAEMPGPSGSPPPGYGTFLGHLANQTLSAACTIPPRPQSSSVVDRTFRLY